MSGALSLTMVEPLTREATLEPYHTRGLCQAGVNVAIDDFIDAYVYAERALAADGLWFPVNFPLAVERNHYRVAAPVTQGLYS